MPTGTSGSPGAEIQPAGWPQMGSGTAHCCSKASPGELLELIRSSVLGVSTINMIRRDSPST